MENQLSGSVVVIERPAPKCNNYLQAIIVFFELCHVVEEVHAQVVHGSNLEGVGCDVTKREI